MLSNAAPFCAWHHPFSGTGERERDSKTLHQVSQGQNKREENRIDRQAQILVYFCVMA